MSTERGSREVTFGRGDTVLAGSLLMPAGPGPVPGVVLVGGSGDSDRTNGGFFPAIGRHLADAGIAVLSYDKRGVGASSGDWRETTMDGLAADAAAGWDLLRAQPGIRPDGVGLFGHSEGGWVVLRAARGRDDIPWVVTNSGPGMTPGRQDRHALAVALRRDDTATERDVEAALALFDRLIEAGRRGADFAEMTRLVGSAPTPPAFADYWTEVDEAFWGFLSRKQDHDPIPDARRLRCPHLAVFGAADELVPVAQSARLFAEAACDPHRDRRATLSVAVFPGADHRLRVADSTDLVGGYLDTLVRWIGARAEV